MGRRGPKNIFLEAGDGELFVWLNAVMNPMIAMFDGIPLAQFKKRWYMRIDDAIVWCKQEGDDIRTLKPELDLKIEVMEKFKAQVEQERADAEKSKA